MSGAQQTNDSDKAGTSEAAGAGDERPRAPDQGDDDDRGLEQPDISVSDLRAKAALTGRIQIYGDFVVGERAKRLTAIDVTFSLGATTTPFVAPREFPVLLAALRARATAPILLHGPAHAGKRLSAARALMEVKCTPIIMLPGDASGTALASEVEMVLKRDPAAGVIVTADVARGIQLDSHALAHLQALLAGSSCAIIFVATSESLERSHVPRACTSVAMTPPPASEVLQEYVRVFAVSEQAAALARRCMDLMTSEPTPPVVLDTLDFCAQNVEIAPEEVVARVEAGKSDESLQRWLKDGRQANEVALLAAGAVLDGVPVKVVRSAASELQRSIEPAPATDGGTRQTVIVPMSESWPSGILTTQREVRSTHFGKRAVEVVRSCPPHTPEWILRYLWGNLDDRFQEPLVAWLHGLSHHRSLRLFAANAAGLLFIDDPVIAEAELIRPWALSDDPKQRQCAGWALGVPVVLNTGVDAARALARHWRASASPALLHAAICAYGGPLGMWDLESYAPLNLFEIGHADVRLRSAADQAMAHLIANSPETAAVRGLAVELLHSYLARSDHRKDVYRVLPKVLTVLCRSDARDGAGFAAFRSDEVIYRAVVDMVARALTDPPGVRHGEQALRVVVQHYARERVRYDDVVDFISDLKAAAQRRREAPRLGHAIRKVLSGLRRSDDVQLSDAARRILSKFF